MRQDLAGAGYGLERGDRHSVLGQVRRAGARSGAGLPGRGRTAGRARTRRGDGPASRSRSRRSRDACDYRACAPARSWSGPRAALGDNQRQLDLSVLLVHHTRKNAAAGVAAGQGLRGSGDIHAFGDSNLYLRRSREHLVLSSEHRAAPASPPVCLQLVATETEATHLEVIGEGVDGSTKLTMDGSSRLTVDVKRRGLEERVLDLLGQGVPVTRAKLRDSLGVKNERLGEVLESLERAGRLRRTSAGWQRLG
jgi:hypothetical protein